MVVTITAIRLCVGVCTASDARTPHQPWREEYRIVVFAAILDAVPAFWPVPLATRVPERERERVFRRFIARRARGLARYDTTRHDTIRSRLSTWLLRLFYCDSDDDGTVRCGMVRCGMVRYGMVWYGMVRRTRYG
jgi:hypothetical protein